MGKKIVINGKFLSQRTTGVQRYARELVSELDRLVMPGEVEIAVPPETENIPEYTNIRVVKIGRLKKQLWEQISFPMYVKSQNAVCVNLCNVAPLVSPDVVCIHDVKIKVRPQDFGKLFRFWYNVQFTNSCKRAKRVITVSAFSQNEISNYCKLPKEKITVVSNSWQHFERVDYDNHAVDKYGLKENSYFFSMSSLEPNKNFKWIAESANRNPNEIFVVAGSINDKVFRDGLGFEVPNNMKLLGYVSDEEAKTLMRECKAFLFPSFYEGFGLPPLEALSAGARNIVVSDIPVMHELFGDFATYVDPSQSDNVSDALNPKAGKGSAEDVLGNYSWEKSAKVLRDVLNQYQY